MPASATNATLAVIAIDLRVTFGATIVGVGALGAALNATKIPGKRVGRRVAVLALLRERLHHDPLELRMNIWPQLAHRLRLLGRTFIAMAHYPSETPEITDSR